jgi:hypothetical protein
MVPHYKPFDEVNFFLNKKGKLRSRYIRAANEIAKHGFDIDRDSDITAFVKLERYFDDSKPPRMILGRNPKFNVVYAQIVQPFEQALFQLDEVANGKDHHGMGEQFASMAGRCSRFVENDMSKYEASQRFTTLKIEYLLMKRFYVAVEPAFIPLLDCCFSACLRNKVKTSLGVYFSFVLCRVSGDLTTSSGNGCINLVTSQYNQVMNTCNASTCRFDVCDNPECRVRDIILKGDDSVLGQTKAGYTDYYVNFGLDAKIIERNNADAVEFCSGRFVEVRPGEWFYVQKLQKLLESLTTCLNQDAIRDGWVAHYYKSLGLMYKVVYKGMPIYEDIADFLLRTNVNYGVNTALISSYNLLDAYGAEHSDHQIDPSMAMLGVSLANEMDYPELERIRAWAQGNKLEFAPDQTKRCNMKSRRVVDCPSVNYQELNCQIYPAKLVKQQREWYNKLVRLV